MDPKEKYKKVVTESSLLTEEEKLMLQDVSEDIPEEHVASIADFLEMYEQQTTERRKQYIAKVSQAFEEYSNTLNGIKNLPEARKKEMISQAEVIVNAIKRVVEEM